MGTVSVHLPLETEVEVTALAKKQDRSLGRLVREAIQNYLDAQKAQEAQKETSNA